MSEKIGEIEKLRIGIVCAMVDESRAFYNEFGQASEFINIGSFIVEKFEYEDKEVFLINSGIGEISGALATQLLIISFKVNFLFNMGFVGSLNPRYSRKQLVLVDEVVHYDFALRYSDESTWGKYYDQRDNFVMKIPNILMDKFLEIFPLEKVRIASGDKFVDDNTFKESLVQRFGCDVCDMESAGIYRACKLHNIPLLMLKCISDSADNDANESFDIIVKSTMDYYAGTVAKFLKSI